MNAHKPMYDLSDALDVAPLEAVTAGTSLLVSGPAMSGTADIARDVLASGLAAGEGAVSVTTNETASDTIAALTDRAPDANPDHICAIDCRGDQDGTQEESLEGGYVTHVGDPSDLTGMGIGITQSFERLEAHGIDRGRLGLNSLSTMLTYTDKQTVFKFCHVLTSRIDSAEYVAAFTIDASAHDAQTLQVIKQPFDGMIEIEERDGVRMARVLGVEPDPSDWVEL